MSGLQLLRSVGINVLRDVSEDEYAGTDTARALRRKRERVAASLREQIRRDPNFFQARPTAIATGAALEKDRARLSQLKGVAGVAEIQSDPRLSLGALQKGKFTKRPGLVYILQRPELEESTLSFKVAGSYSVEEKFIASAGIDEFNMLHWGEQIAFSHAQGPEVLRTQLQFSRPFANKSGKRGWRIEGVGLRAQYWRDNNQRLGNVTAEELAAREAGSRAHFVFGFDSFARTDYQLADLLDEKRPRTHWTLHGQTALEYRDVNIPEDDRLLTITKLSRRLLPDARTQATNLVLTLSGAMSHDLREHNGLGTLTLGFDTTLQRGIGWLGADYRYGKAAFSGRGELFFGPETAHEFFVRHTQGIARSGDRTPVFELFRLGGPNNLRGIEEGEIIGRRLTYGQSEVGVNALALWQMLRRNPTTKESPNSSAKEETRAEAPAFDFSHLYVKGLVDWARISDPTSFAQTNAAGLKRQAQGYGVAVELRNLAAGEGMQKIHLTIGYARSPQSVLHRSGTIFTSVSLNY